MKLLNWVQIDLQYIRMYVYVPTIYVCKCCPYAKYNLDTAATDPTAETQQDGGPDEMKVLMPRGLYAAYIQLCRSTHTQFNLILFQG